MTNKNEIRQILAAHPEYINTLFIRGYLITDKGNIDLSVYPFLNNWRSETLGIRDDKENVYMYVHKSQQYQTVVEKTISLAIIGHAYNPFDMEYDETSILKNLLTKYKKGKDAFLDGVSELSGIHLIIINDGGKLLIVQDAMGMKSCYFGIIDEQFYISSHPQLVGDLLDLKMSDYVVKLIESKMYNIGNRYLPGNLSTFDELKRLGPNTYLKFSDDFSIERFYPNKSHIEINSAKEFNIYINKIVELLKNNNSIISKKWKKPAISMTGGTDSKTTLSTLNGMYRNFSYYSFFSKETELEDAKAANEICSKLNLDHVIYEIPQENNRIKDFKILKRIINHNASYIMNNPDHEIRKLIFMYRLNNFDIEVKSWGGEIARVFYERKYGLKLPERLSERHLSIFQTRFFFTPELLKKSDHFYRKFMEETHLITPLFNYNHADLIYWEVRMGSWGSSVYTSQDLSHEVTIPLNNRKILDMLLWFPKEDRKNDNVHNSIIIKADNRISNFGIQVKNKYFQSYRIYLEKMYFYYRTLFHRN